MARLQSTRKTSVACSTDGPHELLEAWHIKMMKIRSRLTFPLTHISLLYRHQPREQGEAMVRLLPEHNANADARDNDGCTVLHIAVFNGHETVLLLLLEHNTDASTRIRTEG
jgi:ankyrin repeat protein